MDCLSGLKLCGLWTILNENDVLTYFLFHILNFLSMYHEPLRQMWDHLKTHSSCTFSKCNNRKLLHYSLNN